MGITYHVIDKYLVYVDRSTNTMLDMFVVVELVRDPEMTLLCFLTCAIFIMFMYWLLLYHVVV